VHAPREEEERRRIGTEDGEKIGEEIGEENGGESQKRKGCGEKTQAQGGPIEMKKLVASGKTVEEAVENGLSQLGVGRDRVRVTVLEQPAKGLFGLIGAKEAKVELELIPDAAEEAERFLREVAEAMRISVGITRQEADGVVCFNVTGADLGIVIGRRGQTLDALDRKSVV